MAGLPALPLFNPFPGGTDPAVVNDAAQKDKKVRASVLIRGAGWHGADSPIARGVMGAESGFRPDADNGTCCVGLMQMNVPVHAGEYGIPRDHDAAVAWLKDPQNNVKSAHALWQAQGWKPWDTFNDNSYKRFEGKDPLISLGHKTLTGAATDAVTGAVDTALGPVDNIAKALLDRNVWFRIGKGALGTELVILGLGALVLVGVIKASKTAPVKTAIKVAKKVPKV